MFETALVVGDGYPVPTHAPISKFYKVLHGVLGLYLTNKCNMVCTHCCTDSSPRQSSFLDIDEVLDGDKGLTRTLPIRAVHVSGGEPFLQPALLKRIGERAAIENLAFAINTNAFWAKSANKAKDVIANLPGLTQLVISADEYHSAFQPPEWVIEAVTASVEGGLHTQICFCTPMGQWTEFVQATLDELPREIRDRTSVAVNPVELGGRANDLPEAHWRELSSDFPSGLCSLVFRPVILEDGEVQACCNTTVRDRLVDSPLHLGKLADTPLKKMLADAATDPVVLALGLLGPAFLASHLSDARQNALHAPMPKGDICSLCTRIMSNPKAVEEIRIELSHGKAQQMLVIAKNLFDQSLVSKTADGKD